MEPYALLAAEEAARPLGTAGGSWDESTEYDLAQSDTVDLINAAMMEIPSRRIASDPDITLPEGVDDYDVDLSMSSVPVSDGFTIMPGDLSRKDVHKLYRYSNSVLVLPMSGKSIRDVMEENALRFTPEITKDNHIRPKDQTGKYLSAVNGGGLSLTHDAKDLSEWIIEEGSGGIYLINAAIETKTGIEFYGDRFTTYRFSPNSHFTFNFYKVTEP